MAGFPRKRAVLIGVDNYTDVPPLRFSGDDARSIAKAFSDYLEFNPQDILELSIRDGVKPDVETIIKQMGRFLKRDIEPDELLVFFFSGHGMIDETDGKDYLLPIHAVPEELKRTSLPVDFFIEKLTATGCKNIVMFIDACREEIGRAGGGAKGVQGISDDTTEALSRAGIVTFFSCDPKEKSWEIDEIKHGSFTQCLLDSIAKGDCHTVEQVAKFLRDNVPALNAKYKKGAQLPYVVVKPNEKNKLPIFYAERVTPGGSALEDLAKCLDDLFINGNLEDQIYSPAISLIEQAKKSTPLNVRDTRRLEFIKSLCGGKGLAPKAFSRAWKAAERL